MRIISFIISVLIISSLLTGCYYDKEDLLYGPNTCDTTAVATYSAVVAPIMAASCNGCHSTASPAAGIALDNYNGVKAQVTNGKLIGTITWAAGYSAMPKGGSKLPDCNITKIKQWIAAGAQNN